MDNQLQFCTVEEAVEEIRQGRMIIVTDDPGRENEADLIIAAEFATPEAINEIWHMTKPTSGAGGWVVAGIEQSN